eukprot:140524-Alexandrium_andersonii.AAC.1
MYSSTGAEPRRKLSLHDSWVTITVVAASVPCPQLATGVSSASQVPIGDAISGGSRPSQPT